MASCKAGIGGHFYAFRDECCEPKNMQVLVFEKALQMTYLGAEGQILTVTHR
jgi:hypothetical protein